jgi:ABC-type transporter Mla subunit MlaD
MKNKVAAWGFVLVSCINPSLETGLDTLRDEIERLQSQVQVVDVNGLVESVTELESTVDTLVIEFDTLDTTMEELQQMISTLQETVNDLEIAFQSLAPDGTLQGILLKLEKIQEGIDVLVARADYDIDGVINAVDECPDTPITEIKQVNDVGCSPSQLNN